LDRIFAIVSILAESNRKMKWILVDLAIVMNVILRQLRDIFPQGERAMFTDQVCGMTVICRTTDPILIANILESLFDFKVDRTSSSNEVVMVRSVAYNCAIELEIVRNSYFQVIELEPTPAISFRMECRASEMSKEFRALGCEIRKIVKKDIIQIIASVAGVTIRTDHRRIKPVRGKSVE